MKTADTVPSVLDLFERRIPLPGGTGLLLMSGSTGIGKSHNACAFIAAKAPEYRKHGSKIVFTTQALKNLPANIDEKKSAKQLERAYFEAGRMDFYNSEVVVLRSARMHLSLNWERLQDRIEAVLENSGILQDEFGQYCKAVKDFLAHDETDDEEAEFYKIQRAFVRGVGNELNNAFPQEKYASRDEAVAAKKKAMQSDRRWSWIPELWPDHRVDTVTVVLLSLRKFTLPLINVLESSSPLKDSLPDGSLVFIDEFDEAKTAMLTFIIDDCMKKEVDIIDLSRSIGAQLIGGSFLPLHLLKHSSGDSDKKAAWIEKKLAQYEKLKDKYRAIEELYNLKYYPLSAPGNSERSSRFMNRSFQPFHWTGSAGNQVLIADPENNVNWIQSAPSGGKNESEYPRLSDLVHDLSDFIDLFLQLCNDLILNWKGYLNHAREEGASREIINWNIQDFIATVITHFVPNPSPLFDYLSYALRQQQYSGVEGRIHPGRFDIDQFYTRGFFLIQLEDSDWHQSRTRLKMLSFSPTPEAWIAKLAGKSFVVGMSATCYIDQPLTNFSLGYFRRTLGKNYYELDDQDMKKLKELYRNSVAGYDSIEFCPKNPKNPFISSLSTTSRDAVVDRWSSMVADRTLAERIYNELAEACRASGASRDKSWFDFIVSRYDRVFSVMESFASASEPHALFALLPILFRSSGTHVLVPLELFSEGLLHAHPDSDWELRCIGSRVFEAEVEKIKEALSARKRVFICTSYATMSRGVNLQFSAHRYPESVFVHGDAGRRGDMVDIDGMYLDKPTNILTVYDESRNSRRNLVSRLAHLHYLAADGYFTETELDKYIRASLAMQPWKMSGNALVPQAVNAAIVSQTLQAVGRMSRTARRMPKIFLFAQDEIAAALASVRLPSQVIRTREFDFLAQGLPPQAESFRVEEQRIEVLSNTLNRIINTMIRRFDDVEIRTQWTSFRTSLLRNPKPRHMNEADFPAAYCELPTGCSRYWYRTHDDFFTCEASLKAPVESGWTEVSERNSRLPELMEVEGVRDYFTAEGIICEWPDSRIFLSPVAFNNIYRGALGEAILVFFFREAFGIELQSMPDGLFEKFDFMISPGMYADSKFWSWDSQRDDRREQERILGKLDACCGERAFIINTFPSAGTPDVCILPSLPNLVLVNAVFAEGKIWDKAVSEIRRLL